MASKVWTVQFERAHLVELQHGTKTGSRSILVDGAAIDLGPDSKKLMDTGSVHRFPISGRIVEIHIEPVGFGRWHYRLKADGEWLDPPVPERKLPPWAFAFVLLACIPAYQVIRVNDSMIALVLCVATAIGASAAILANARDPLLPTERKLMKCVLLAGLVWGVFAIPGLMMLGAMQILNG